mmetsp:Transcript_13737/g.26352  ORF Transcript_13737/g.26352 Transcript_13737/m.26352 type:complete len:290 (-) Transcript_13737:161-1030(-)
MRLRHQFFTCLFGGLARCHYGHGLLVGDELPDTIRGKYQILVFAFEVVDCHIWLRCYAYSFRQCVTYCATHGQPRHPGILEPDAVGADALAVFVHQALDSPLCGRYSHLLHCLLRLVVLGEGQGLEQVALAHAAQQRARVARPRHVQLHPLQHRRHRRAPGELAVHLALVQLGVHLQKRHLQRRRRALLQALRPVQRRGQQVLHKRAHQVAVGPVPVQHRQQAGALVLGQRNGAKAVVLVGLLVSRLLARLGEERRARRVRRVPPAHHQVALVHACLCYRLPHLFHCSY